LLRNTDNQATTRLHLNGNPQAPPQVNDCFVKRKQKSKGAFETVKKVEKDE